MFCVYCGVKSVENAAFCHGCGKKLVHPGITPLSENLKLITPSQKNIVSNVDVARQDNEPVGIGGWLLFLIAQLLVGSSAWWLAIASEFHASGEWFLFLLTPVLLPSTIIYFAAGILLLTSRKLKRIDEVVEFLWVGGPGIGVLQGVGFVFFLDMHVSDVIDSTIGPLLGNLIWTIIWTSYLSNSKRVANTYTEPLVTEQDTPAEPVLEKRQAKSDYEKLVTKKLIYAVKQNDLPELDRMLEKGANPFLEDEHGKNACDYANELNKTDALEILQRSWVAKFNVG